MSPQAHEEDRFTYWIENEAAISVELNLVFVRMLLGAFCMMSL